MREYINRVIDWAMEREIFSKGTTAKQALKVQEETGELVLAVGQHDLPGVVDGIGDVLVTLVILSEMYGLTLEKCLETALKEIEPRTGSMIGGTFIKDIK